MYIPGQPFVTATMLCFLPSGSAGYLILAFANKFLGRSYLLEEAFASARTSVNRNPAPQTNKPCLKKLVIIIYLHNAIEPDPSKRHADTFTAVWISTSELRYLRDECGLIDTYTS